MTFNEHPQGVPVGDDTPHPRLRPHPSPSSAGTSDDGLRERLAAGYDPARGSEELGRRLEAALARWDVTPTALRGLARRAAVDYYAARGGAIGGDLLERAIAFILTPGLQAVVSYDPERAGGVSVTTFAYRRMRQRMTDFLRSKAEGFGDARSGNDGRESLTSDGELRSVAVPVESVERAADELAGGLSERSGWTLRHVATAVAEGLTLVEVVEELLGDLADELGAAMPDRLRSQLVVDGDPDPGLYCQLLEDAA